MSEPSETDAVRAILEALVTDGAREPQVMAQYWADNSLEDEMRARLERLLTGRVPAELLFSYLAKARRPQLGSFMPRLRERLGGAALEAETIATLRRGLASADELLCNNALMLLRCAPAQLHQVETEVVALLTNLETPVRTHAADTLRVFPALSPPSVKALTWLAIRQARFPDGRAAREALYRHGAPVALPPDGIDTLERVRWLLPLPFLSGSFQLLGDDGALYFDFDRLEDGSRPTPEQGWAFWV